MPRASRSSSITTARKACRASASLGWPASGAGRIGASKNERQGRPAMIHELRIYKCMPGRLPDLNKRFESVTLKLWERHGFKPVGFWTVRVGPSNQDLYYLLEWKDMAESERVW